MTWQLASLRTKERAKEASQDRVRVSLQPHLGSESPSLLPYSIARSKGVGLARARRRGSHSGVCIPRGGIPGD